MEESLFNIGSTEITMLKLVQSIGTIIVLSFLMFTILRSQRLKELINKSSIDIGKAKQLRRISFWLTACLLFFLLLFILEIDYPLFTRGGFSITIQLIAKGLVIIQLARLIDWLIANVLVHRYYVNRDIPVARRPIIDNNNEGKASRMVQITVYAIAAFFIIKNLNLDISLYQTEVTQKDGTTKVIDFQLSRVLSALLIVVVTRFLVWLFTEIFLYGIYNRRKIDQGSRFAVNQLIKYLAYVIAILIALDHLGINMTLIWTGAAALLVGIGLGLQQTFNDFISGLVLLFERTTSVGDILEFENHVGQVRKIGMRASIIETRFNKTVVVPNSKIVNDKVTNWSHFQNRVRFEVKVGVAYGSDTTLVKELLLASAKGHHDVLDYPTPFVRFESFGGSSLDFTLSFFSKKYLVIEDIKSDIRFSIDKSFREHNISIPFPQLDVWYRNKD